MSETKAISGRAHDDDKWWAAFLLLTAADYARADVYWKSHAGPMFSGLIESPKVEEVTKTSYGQPDQVLKDAPFRYDPSRQRYIRSNGRAVKDDEIRALLIALLASASDSMETDAQQMVAGVVPLDVWQAAQAEQIKDLYIASYAVGRGGLAQITEDDAKEIIGKKSGEALAGALKKLRRFGKQIESEGETAETPAQIVNRAGLYANPAHTLYEVGRHQAHKNAKDEDGKQILYEESNVLDDQAQHCKTEEHTDGCPEVTDQGWQPFGTLPLPGHRTCGSACRCKMKYRPIENPSPPLTMSTQKDPLTGLILESEAEAIPVLTLGQSRPTEVNGDAVYDYWKEVLIPGKLRDSKGKYWEISPADIDTAIADGDRALKLGFEPLIQDDHFKPTTSYGVIKGFRKNSRGNLEWLHRFAKRDGRTAEENRDKALAKKISPMLIPEFTDSRDRKFKWWPEHSASTFRPTQKELQDFVPALAASDGQAVNAVYLTLADGELPMLDLKPLRDILGETAKDQPDEKVLALSAEMFIETRTKLKDQKEANVVLVTELRTVEGERDTAKQALSLSEEAPDPENPRLIAMGVKSANSDINAAIAEHKINPKQAEYLRGRIKTSPALALADDVGNPSAIDDLIAFASLGADDPQPKNPVVRGRPVEPLKELALSEGEENPSLTAERRKELLGMVGYTVA